MTDTKTIEPAGGTYPSNEDTVKTVIERLKNASLEISKSGNELYHIFGVDKSTTVVYDAIPILEGVIIYLESITHAEYLMNAE